MNKITPWQDLSNPVFPNSHRTYAQKIAELEEHYAASLYELSEDELDREYEDRIGSI